MFLLIIVSAAFGLSIGLYDLLLPLFLDHMGMSYGKMGIIFSFSAIFLFFIRIYAGHISDIIGRKHIFSLSLFLSSIANLGTPFFPFVSSQVVLKSFRESSIAIKETLQQLLIFDKWKESFRHLTAWVAGFDVTFQGIGAILGGFLLVKIGYRYSFIFSGTVVFVVCMLFLFRFKEKFTPFESRASVTSSDSATARPFSWSSPFRHRLTYPLFLIAISGFIMETGVSMSHSFMLPLFFYHKFSLSPVVVSAILALHRLSFGIPMIVTGKVVKWNLKRTTIIFMLMQGIFMALTAVPASFLVAAIIWLMHDFVGASLWQPARVLLFSIMQEMKVGGLMWEWCFPGTD